ncbi:fibroblast growth factor 1-like [Anoplophora glabripennis]|uniref:fibroblast growth factor 1-like n=1 Tax=Anoplophora glabripennis TaxID=217634 RepID=UPI000873C7A8|nr:fibroblast growth factor 1-like [Anoplophora glabripennis]XP_018574821.1 fibroblast growth factor 1-like [Anoplophora glabripennis]XP_018574822.1 fibroblast growth factor 1-like [Anoplophora glabripennis]XP_018574823.1 fibroblast growth factor 1-like [Anoplophora glabripennis]
MANDRPFGYRMQLYSETGYNLTVRNTGEILGTQDDGDVDSHIELCGGGDVSHIRLLGLNSNLYICFRSNGELYGESDPSNRGTIFIEEFQGSYSAYKSALYPEWYIGIKNNGSPKKGFRTKYGQKAIKYLPRRL